MILRVIPPACQVEEVGGMCGSRVRGVEGGVEGIQGIILSGGGRVKAQGGRARGPAIWPSSE